MGSNRQDAKSAENYPQITQITQIQNRNEKALSQKAKWS